MKNVTIRTSTPFDIVIIVVLVAVSIALWPFFSNGGPGIVLVYRDNAEIARYALDASNEYTFRGDIGPMKIAIANNSVRVVESGCPRGICIQTGAIKIRGQQIVCAPNHILITIETSLGKQVDGIAQ